MDNNNSDTSLDKMILIAGLTGTELKTIYKWLHRHSKELIGLEPKCIIHYEEELLKSRGNGYCLGIDQLAGIIPISRESGRKQFEEPAHAILKYFAEEGCRVSIVFIHLTYLSHGVVITNPALGVLMRSVKNINVIYLIEDFYDALDRVKARLEENTGSVENCGKAGLIGTPFTIDPLEYITWRAADYNLLTALETFKPGLRTFLLGVKHPPETFKRLLKSIIENVPHTLRGRIYMYTYASHPISVQRKLYASKVFNSLSENPLVIAIEAFKEALIEGFDNIVLFEPTAVDELLADPFKDLMRELEICSDPERNPWEGGGMESNESRCRAGQGLEADSAVEKTTCWDVALRHLKRICQKLGREHMDNARETLENVIVYHSVLVKRNNRWPLHKTTLYEEAARAVSNGNRGIGYPYRDSNSKVNLLASRLLSLYGDQEARTILLITNSEIDELIETKLTHYIKNNNYNNELKINLYDKLVFHIKKQIEMRDYHYVSQSSVITVILPIVVAPRKALKTLGVDEKELGELAGIYYVLSSGMEAEMQRAIALARPIIVYMLPVGINALINASSTHGKKDGDNAKKRIVINILKNRKILKKCSSEITLETGSNGDNLDLLPSVGKCADNLGGLFTPTSSGVRYCIVPHLLDANDVIRDSYYDALEELKRKYKEALAPGSCSSPSTRAPV